MKAPTQSRILQAVELLSKEFDRRGAASLLKQELALGAAAGDRWRSVAKLAAKIGEIDIAVEAARRYADSAPLSLEHQLFYWGELATHGRHTQALNIVRALSEARRNQPAIMHFQATLAAQEGNFQEAETLFRRALKAAPFTPQTWFALAMIKTFAPGDPDLAQMERLAPSMAQAEPSIYARFLFGLGKARHDCKDYDKAFEYYAQGAALRRREEPHDPNATTAFVTGLIRDFTPETMRAFRASGCDSDRAIFVNGVPRSGTTLVEQIIASHSAVGGGAEINLLAPALIPTGDYSFAGAMAYQKRSKSNDCWGEIANDYLSMIGMRFQTSGRIIDKTLGQSHLMGLLLSMLPRARVIWLRRQPEDSALSTFRSYFTAPTPWSWSLEDIAQFYREEDRLFQHWTQIEPDRILPIRYEDLVKDPQTVIPQIINHVGLSVEPGVFEPHKAKRSVRTASVKQVRSPVSTSSVGAARAYDRQMEAFRRVYHQRD